MANRSRLDRSDPSFEMALTSSSKTQSSQNPSSKTYQISREGNIARGNGEVAITKPSTLYPRAMDQKYWAYTHYNPVSIAPSINTENGPEPPVMQETNESRVYPKMTFWRSLRWWQPELFAMFLTLASLVALVIVLHHYDGVAVVEHAFLSTLTLNGLIALLSTFMRAALVLPIGSSLSQEAWVWMSRNRYHSSRHGQLRDFAFSDAASRGAYGSFISLFHRRRSWLAYLAALIMIISLGISLFTQQLVSLKTFPTSDPSLIPGNVPRLEFFGYDGFQGNPAEGGEAISVNLPLKAATYNGILSNSPTPATPFCATGNCTWPVTPSLAFCGGCQNVKPVRQQCSTTGDDGTPTCQIKMPSGTMINLTNTYAAGGQGTGFQVSSSPGYIYPTSDPHKLWVSNFEMVGAPYDSFGDGVGAPGSTINAVECAIWMCVQAYETNTTTSQTTQDVVQEFSQVYNGSLDSIGGGNATFLPIPSSMNPRPGASFYVVGLALEAFNALFMPLFNGTIYLNLESQTPSSDVVQAMWQASSNNPDAWMKSLATSMTNGMRTNLPQPNDRYNGTAYQLGYHIRWIWLILPGVLVALSVLVLFATIVKTARSTVRPWKGSPLAYMFLHIDNHLSRGAEGTMGTFRGVEKLLGHTRVNVMNSGEGQWQLRRENQVT